MGFMVQGLRVSRFRVWFLRGLSLMRGGALLSKSPPLIASIQQ